MLASYLEDIRGQKIVQHGYNSTIQTLPFKHVLGYAVVILFNQTEDTEQECGLLPNWL